MLLIQVHQTAAAGANLIIICTQHIENTILVRLDIRQPVVIIHAVATPESHQVHKARMKLPTLHTGLLHRPQGKHPRLPARHLHSAGTRPAIPLSVVHSQLPRHRRQINHQHHCSAPLSSNCARHVPSLPSWSWSKTSTSLKLNAKSSSSFPSSVVSHDSFTSEE